MKQNIETLIVYLVGYPLVGGMVMMSGTAIWYIHKELTKPNTLQGNLMVYTMYLALGFGTTSLLEAALGRSLW